MNEIPTQALSDDALVSRCQAELPYDTRAFTELLRRYEPSVFRTCCQYLGNEQDAEEVSQEVMLRVFRKIKQYEGRSSFQTWLYRVTANLCATRYAKLEGAQRLRREYVDDRLVREFADTEARSGVAPEMEGLVGAVFERLEPAERQALVLRHVSGLSFQEIADALEIGLSAAKMRVYRAEEHFRQLTKG